MAEKTHLVFGNALNEPVATEREQGDLYFDTGVETDRLPHGVTGQILSTGGHAANPSWVTAPVANATHTGDVTGGTTLTIASEAVTYAKMQHVSANKVLGSTGGGDVSEIACTAAGRALLDDANAAAQLVTLGAMPLAGGTLTGAAEAADHGTAATDQLVNVCYGTGDPPAAATTTEGTLFIKYTA